MDKRWKIIKVTLLCCLSTPFTGEDTALSIVRNVLNSGSVLKLNKLGFAERDSRGTGWIRMQPLQQILHLFVLFVDYRTGRRVVSSSLKSKLWKEEMMQSFSLAENSIIKSSSGEYQENGPSILFIRNKYQNQPLPEEILLAESS